MLRILAVSVLQKSVLHTETVPQRSDNYPFAPPAGLKIPDNLNLSSSVALSDELAQFFQSSYRLVAVSKCARGRLEAQKLVECNEAGRSSYLRDEAIG